MKAPSLADALAKKDAPPAPQQVDAPTEEASPEPKAPPRVATSLRMDAEQLERLKIIAARRRVRVNDLILQGVEHILALYNHDAKVP